MTMSMKMSLPEDHSTARHASILQDAVVPRANADPVRNHVAQYDDDNDATKKALKSVANKQAK